MTAYIVSIGLKRRDMSKGAKAMIYAKRFADVHKGGRGKKNLPLQAAGFSNDLLVRARLVLKVLPEFGYR